MANHSAYGVFLLACQIALASSASAQSTSAPQRTPEPAPTTGASAPMDPNMKMPNTNMPNMNDGQGMPPGMDMNMPGMHMQPATFLEEVTAHDTSGTDAQPDSTPVPMLMTSRANWNLMFHANVFLAEIQESGPRGGDKLFSTNWLMGMAQHKAGPGTFTARVMLSLEPATITGRQYPLLFQQGETAFGKPIADGQHPHDFIMELAALYDAKLGERTLLTFYFAPVGDPALGPIAYPHRASAAEDPLAALGHHQMDSTHISDDVITAGLAHGIFRVEASGFHGREPDEVRWNIDQGKIDSWSVRGTVQPGKNWSAQYSYGRLASPEALFPAENQERMTASIMYNRPLARGNWASTLAWGRTQALSGGSPFNSFLFESLVRFATRNYAWTRIESADRSNELLLGENTLPPGFEETRAGRVEAYTLGYDHDFDLLPDLASAVGAQVTLYTVPTIFQPPYGAHPAGVAIFIRLRPYSKGER